MMLEKDNPSLVSPISNIALINSNDKVNDGQIINQYYSNMEPNGGFYRYSNTSSYKNRSSFNYFNSNKNKSSNQTMSNKASIASLILPIFTTKTDKTSSMRRASVSILKNRRASTNMNRKSFRGSIKSGRLSSANREASTINASQFNQMISDSNKKSPLTKMNHLIKVIDIILAIVVSGNIVMSLIENEIYYDETEKYLDALMSVSESKIITRETYRSLEKRTITSKENAIRFINLILVTVLILFTFFHYILTLNKKKKEGILSENDGLVSSGLLPYCLFECFILIWTDPPYINYFITGTMEGYDFAFSLGGLICIICMFKSYLVIRVYTYFSKWTTETAISLCNNWGVNPGVHFAFKAELKYRPFSMLTVIFTAVMVSFGFALRTFEFFAISSGTEYTSMKGNGNDQDYLKDLVNSVWEIILTMTTVGYGDFVPNENYGRFICVIACILGLLLVSVIVVSLAIISEFSDEEKKAYSLLKKLNADNNVILKAAEVISALCILRMRAMGKNSKLSERFVHIMKLKQSISVFKDDFKIATSMSLPLDRTFKIINQEIKENYDNLTENIGELKKIGKYTAKISHSQKECVNKMKTIRERQLRIGNFLVRLNNKKLKQSINLFDSFSNMSFK